MPLPDQTPKLPKLPFLVGDAALLAAAWFIANRAPDPWSTETIFTIAGCVFGAAILGAIPFVTDYARKQDEALDDRQRGLEALARTVATSAEQISIAAQGLHEIADLAAKNLKQAEQLPRQLQEKIVGLQARSGGGRDGEREALEKELAARRASETDRIEAAVDKLAKAAAEWTKAETAAQKRLAAVTKERDEAPAPVTPIREVAAESPAEPPAEATPPAPELVVLPSIEALAAEATAAPTILPFLPEDGEPIAPVAKPPRKPRAPRKPKVEVPASPAAEPPEPPAPSESAATLERPENLEPPETFTVLTEPVVAAPAEPSEFSQLEPDEAAPAPAVSADGAMRLLVTAYIGIGNRIFIRGDGPGLSWEKGVPLQFVSIGKWRWEAADAAAPVRFKLYKNDELECVALGERTLEPGRQQEFTASF